MASKLINHLKSCIANDPSLAVLGHQWGFDEQLIPKALQNIGTLYTDYSLHDASHSKQILINIERVLGDSRIKLLTATDTWLLLEAAYWHDIGMVVTREQFDSACNSPDFWTFIERIKEDPHHPSHELCNGFNFDTKLWSLNSNLPFTLVQSFKGLFSEWFRTKHSKMSMETIKSPWEKANLSSPRTELIPNRLFSLLGKICESHGATFDNIISDVLPYKEVGIGTEDCHPRYIASLLRLGDLLDIDDNRFCPIMMKIAGNSRSNLSKIHEIKHRSIRHFRLDSEVIEIECECNGEDLELGIDSYLEAINWLTWLEEELKNQMTHWTKIAPNRELGLLPTLGKVSVKFSDKDYFLPTDSRPEFGIDIRRSINILQDLYTDQFVCIRELLQNSVDATYIRAFLDKSDDFSKDKYIDLNYIKKTLENYEINLFIEEISDGNILKLRLTIIDNGAGISLNDFYHMMKIGGSRDNITKKKIINQMPKILQPSGTFGIGFQSIFLLSDKVSLTTKSSISDEKLKVNMYNPLGNKQGLCTFKLIKERIPYGTKLEVDLNFDESELEDSKKLSVSRNFTDNALADRFLFDGKSIIKANLLQKVNEFKQNSLVPINIKSNDDLTKFFDREISDIDNIDWKLTEVNGELYRYSIVIAYSNATKRVLFKGQHVAAPTARQEDGNTKFSYFNLLAFSICIDFLSHDSSEWLTAQRNKIRDSKFDEFSMVVEKILNNENNTIKSAFAFSILSNSYFHLYERKDDLKDIWRNDINKNNILDYNNNEITIYNKDHLKASINGISFTLSSEHSNPPPNSITIHTTNGSVLQNAVISAVNNQALFLDNFGYEFKYKKDESAFIYKYMNSDKKTIDDNYLASVFYCGHKLSGCRPLIPYSDDLNSFSSLFVSLDKIPYYMTLNSKINTPRMAISPYVLIQKNQRNSIQNSYNMDYLESFCEKLITKKIIVDMELKTLISLYTDFAGLITKKIHQSNIDELKLLFDVNSNK